MSQYQANKYIFIVICDIACIVIVYIPWIVLVWGGVEPFRRGFFCDDQSISYPFNESTVPGVVMEALGFIIPASFIIIIEGCFVYKLRNSHTLKSYQWKGINIHPFVIAFYKIAVIYTFGAALQQTLSNICKYSSGRLRPHFFDICNISLTDDLCIDNVTGLAKYVTEYTCRGDAENVKDARLSFFSGHSSNSSYTSMFVIIYLQFRFSSISKAVIWRVILQIVLFLYALLVGLSRIMDYKHHWSDVLAGSLVGAICAVFMTCGVSNFFYFGLDDVYVKWKESMELYPQTQTHLSNLTQEHTPSRTQTHTSTHSRTNSINNELSGCSTHF